MALTYSTGSGLGAALPPATLQDPDGRPVDLSGLRGPRGTLVAVTCNHCPYAQAVWGRVIDLARRARPLGVHTVAVNPNLNPAYPDDSLEGMKRAVAWLGIDFPYLADADQSFARALGAACTPEFFLYDAEGRLAYHGRLDDDWKDASKVTRRDLWDAVQAVAEGRAPDPDQKPSMGCSIKWL